MERQCTMHVRQSRTSLQIFNADSLVLYRKLVSLSFTVFSYNCVAKSLIYSYITCLETSSQTNCVHIQIHGSAKRVVNI